MRRIFIDSHIEAIADEYAEEVMSGKKYGDSILHPDYFLGKLIKAFDDGNVCEYTSSTTSIVPADIDDFKRYVRAVRWFYKHGLLTAKPKKMRKYKVLFDKILPSGRLKAKLKVGSRKVRPFNEIIVSCLQYSLVRHYVACKYIKRLGIKACVYCNADFTVTTKDGQAFYDIDHWKPQSQYPFLAISFFNMQPSCHACNGLKNDDDTHEYFGLYEEDPNAELEVFRFIIEPADLARYLISGQPSAIHVKYEAKSVDDQQMRDNMDQRLCITKRYAEHADVAEEIIRKKRFYNQAFLDSLKPIFQHQAADSSSNTFFFNGADVKRFILGFYIDDQDIHKRPLNKMMLDIFKGIPS